MQPELAPRGHVVLADADSQQFTSLRRRPTTRAERYEIGRGLRKAVPRSSLGRVGSRRWAARTRSPWSWSRTRDGWSG